jgi:hypothetical protein
MKYFVFLVFVVFTPIANAALWIDLVVAESFTRYIDIDSIKREGDIAYYTMTNNISSDKPTLYKFKHDCKYKTRRELYTLFYSQDAGEWAVEYPPDIGTSEYARIEPLIKIEKIVCKY